MASPRCIWRASPPTGCRIRSQLAVDLRVQHALRDELVAARAKFSTIAAAGVVLNVRTGEIVAMVSEPDYDPNNPHEAHDPTRINRLTTGVYEMGSTFKAFTVAMALDSGKATLKSTFDAHNPLHYGKFDIHDFEPMQRALTCRRSSPIRRTSARRASRWRSASTRTRRS